MNAQDSTIANADLWSKYFQDQWSWLTPRDRADDSVVRMAAGNGARVANFLTLVAAGPIAWMYANNAPKVRPLRVVDSEPASFTPDMESVEEHAA